MYPETFEHEMHVRLGPGYRLRWLLRKEVYAIEQKMGHGYADPGLSSDREDYERVRDGYALVMECSPTPWLTCTTCFHKVPLHPLQTHEARCGYCYSKGEKSMYFAGFWPLCERLLKHLEAGHPRRTAEWKREMAAHNNAVVRAAERRHANELEACALEYRDSVMRVPRTYLADHRTY